MKNPWTGNYQYHPIFLRKCHTRVWIDLENQWKSVQIPSKQHWDNPLTGTNHPIHIQFVPYLEFGIRMDCFNIECTCCQKDSNGIRCSYEIIIFDLIQDRHYIRLIDLWFSLWYGVDNTGTCTVYAAQMIIETQKVVDIIIWYHRRKHITFSANTTNCILSSTPTTILSSIGAE